MLRLLHSCIAAPQSSSDDGSGEKSGALAAGLPTIGVRCLRQLLLAAGGAFSGAVWDGVCREVTVLFAQTVPTALVAEATRAALKLPPREDDSADDTEDGDSDQGAPSAGSLAAAAQGDDDDEQQEDDDAKRWREQQEAAAAQEATERAEAAAHAHSHRGGGGGGGGSQGGLPFDAVAVVNMCNVQLELQAAVGEVASCHFAALSQVCVLCLMCRFAGKRLLTCDLVS